MTKNTDGQTFYRLGEDIDKGMKRLREETYDEYVVQQLGGMSAVMTFEVDEHISTLDTWIRYVRQNTNYDDKVIKKDDVMKESLE